MRMVSLGSKWILGCTAFGLFALCATHSGAAPNDPGVRPAARESRAGLVSRSILRLQMVDAFRTDRGSFLPTTRPENAFEDLGSRGHREARGHREVRGNHPGRGVPSHQDGRDEVDLLAVVGAGGSEGAGAVTPIPEPSSLFLLAAGAGLVAYAARRRFA